MSFDYRMTDVLPLLGISCPSNRMSFNIPCPVCDTDGRDKHLNINLQKNTFRCPRCGDVQGGVLDLYALFAGCSRAKAYKEISKDSVIDNRKKAVSQQPENRECELAPVSQRDKTYRALLSLLALMPSHVQNLHERGLDDEQISFYGFKSAVPDQTHELGAELSKQGYTLKGVPGFYMDSEIWRFRCDYSGILIPVLDPEGRIQGLQLRLDSKEKRKFRWVSSGGLIQGTPAMSFTHYIGNRSETVLLTEGPMKADIINAFSGLPVIAVPGVNCLSLLEITLRELKDHGTKHIMSAFDMDFISNPHVQDGYKQMRSLLEKIGFSYGTYLWDPKYKGLDDYLWLHEKRNSDSA